MKNLFTVLILLLCNAPPKASSAASFPVSLRSQECLPLFPVYEMRRLLLLTLVFATAIAASEWRVIRRRVARSPVSPSPVAVNDELIKQLQRERKERRMLRKKKQKLKELRAEIRQLTMQRRHPEMVAVVDSAEVVRKPKKDGKWKRKLIEKLKGIVRRLDRIERQKKSPRPQTVNLVTAVEPPVVATTTVASSTTPLLKTSISTPAEDTKMRRIQSSIEQARSGENGTSCASHADCRPGRCCQKASLRGHITATCTFFSLVENSPCTDSCQCANRLLCFHPKDNSTKPYCKKAESSDITSGVYLNEKAGIFTKEKRRK